MIIKNSAFSVNLPLRMFVGQPVCRGRLASPPVMVGAYSRGPGSRILASDPCVLPAPGAVHDTLDAWPEEIPGNQVELAEGHQNHGPDEKLGECHTYHFTTLQTFPKRPERA